ncbi:MAG: formylglycine-generating enzyme family protein [Myxococcales bacterium]|nr:formylglycine-generating enzyme family protein [Myxococcales bacterium]
MAWIPAGTLRAGSAPDELPRVAGAELPGADVPLAGFYIDTLPWPNEQGAIPTTNVTRDEAARLCATKRKRLCTELEWERACKGPDNTRYEYGSVYDASSCGSGAHAEGPDRRPSGESLTCRSGFGVREMHGGAWEWTDSRWGRGSTADLGVIRGGSDAEGELSMRCAFARSMAPGDRSPGTGFRCCAGPRNDAEVHLDVKTGPLLERVASRPSPALDALGGISCGGTKAASPCWVARTWVWRPEPNVELTVGGGCVGHWPTAHCGVAVSRGPSGASQVILQVDTGQAEPDVVYVSRPEGRLRLRAADVHGRFVREIVYSYGRLQLQPSR